MNLNYYIFSYRLSQAFKKKVLHTYVPEKRAIIVYRKIVEAIHIHKRAIKFVYKYFIGNKRYNIRLDN